MHPEDITSSRRLSGLLKRFHTWPTIREQTVAEHSWHVLRIYMDLFDAFPTPSVVRYITFHDCGEIAVGDLPYPVKSLDKELKAKIDVMEEAALMRLGIEVPVLTGPYLQQVKLCHMLEMWEYGVEEYVRGNRFALPILQRCEEAAINMTLHWFEKEKINPCNYHLNKQVGDWMRAGMQRFLPVNKQEQEYKRTL